ncbi:hypothetical protein [Pelagovum pacificum]|uniref:Uncharacterized protein n=1 Tax=Pelagovum pacificum TaxID=2588711 RepID=A0A5C5GFQ2_9RHOB|nr:hypothetical protein [Pelagovum pacificum]QQA44072.1 hypothetical protein I8N54_05710 [Pelagovum pacificum]TNY32799.1 hypothetical protein FHY64_05850 [Pelagovum pacificum]
MRLFGGRCGVCMTPKPPFKRGEVILSLVIVAILAIGIGTFTSRIAAIADVNGAFAGGQSGGAGG